MYLETTERMLLSDRLGMISDRFDVKSCWTIHVED
jgi:hypothetical protein